jgi:hypothetical protein
MDNILFLYRRATLNISRLGKWLFLAEAGNEEFEQVAERIISAVLRCDPRTGFYPTSKKKTQH